MAAQCAAFLFQLACLYLCTLYTIVISTNNITHNDSYMTKFSSGGSKSNVTDGYETLPTGGTRTEANEANVANSSQSYGGAEYSDRLDVVSVPGNPLPESGRLPAPLTDVSSICPCDNIPDECDVNCCCDKECRGEDMALFTGCSVSIISAETHLCSHQVASYSLRSTAKGFSELQGSVAMETSHDLLCIQSQNRVNGFSYLPPAVPMEHSFDGLSKRFAGFSFTGPDHSLPSDAGTPDSPGYLYGEVMLTAEEDGHHGFFWLPARGVTSHCVDQSPAAFLKKHSGRCLRQVDVVQDCRPGSALSVDTYVQIQLYSGKNENATIVPVELASLTLLSPDGTERELNATDLQQFFPEPVEAAAACTNVVLEVAYTVWYSPDGQVVGAMATVVLGFVLDRSLPLDQLFEITFLQKDSELPLVSLSGRPGYVAGLPLLSGHQTPSGISRSVNPAETLSLLHGTEDQDCLQGIQARLPVLFGLDAVSGCMLRLEDAANCSLVSRMILNLLRGQNYPQYVASFGDSPLDSLLSWVPVRRSFSPEESESCRIPLSLHLEIEWTKYGSLENPQAQVVSVREEIQTNTSSLALLAGGSHVLPIRSSVSFLSVSAAAVPGFRATPTINAKLPFDFFFPFV